MKHYWISRTYATKYVWTVEAETEEEALAMLDDEDQTPTESADEVWIGPVQNHTRSEMRDSVQEVY